MEFTDVFGFKHTDCVRISTTGKYNRVIIIEDPYKMRYVCINPDISPSDEHLQHWSPASPQDAPADYFGNFKRDDTND